MTTADHKPVTILQAKVRMADPHDCTDDKDALSILSAVFDTLVRREGADFVPSLATSWKVSTDARTWRFELRPDAVFHDGTLCDAAAVVQSIQRMARADMGHTLGAPGVWHQYLGGADIRAEDAHTVLIVLKEPIADLLDILVQGYVAAPAMIAQADAGETPVPIGSGPYRVTQLKPDAISAARVKDHPRRGGPAQVLWTAMPDADARLAKVKSGAADLATGLRVTQGTTPPGITCVTYENPVSIIYLLNAAKGPLSDKRMRMALNLAIDRKAILDAVRGGAGTVLHAIMPALSLGAADARPVAQDMNAARALVVEAGYPQGVTLKLDCPTRLPDEAEALTEELGKQLAPLGLRLDVTCHTDREAYAHMVRRKEIGDLCVFDSSPVSTFRVLYEKIDSRVAGSWWQGYRNLSIEGRMDTARRCVDTRARADIHADILLSLQQDPPWITLYTPMQAVALSGAHTGFAMPTDAVLDVTQLPECVPPKM